MFSKYIQLNIVLQAIKESFKRLNPVVQFRNPVMFVAYLGAVFTTVHLFFIPSSFNIQIAIWLWFTVLFANFAESLAESRGKAQATSLRKMQKVTQARRVVSGVETEVSIHDLVQGDMILCEAGNIVPADGEIIEGVATVDESAITGESAPVIRESGGDRSAVIGGTKVLSDHLLIRITSKPGNSFIDRMIRLIEGAKRQKTPNEIALNIVLSCFTIVFLLCVTSLKLFNDYSQSASINSLDIITVPILISLMVCLIPTTISALLSAIGIAGMARLMQKNVIAKSGHAVEAAGNVDLLLLDKTGTITLGNRMASAFFPAPGVDEIEFATIAQLASLSDETPEGRSIVIFAKANYNLRAETISQTLATFIPFNAKERMSGVDFLDSNGKIIRSIRKGAVDTIRAYVEKKGGVYPLTLAPIIENIAKSGGTPLLVSDNARIVGVIYLKDVVKGGIQERFAKLRKMGLRTVMITGDNAITAASIAAEAGVDDFIAQADPETKLKKIKDEQAKGILVGMIGDGTNDAPALAQADIGVAMHSGTQVSLEAGNMIDLDSNPTKLIEIIEVGKELLMTRGSLTAFSFANDLAKYFAILPSIFYTLYLDDKMAESPLHFLNILHLRSYETAILSAVIFNALIIICLIPLALKGVHYKATSPHALLRKNVLLYGLGGVITPFIGIKLIDMFLGWV